MKYRVMFLVSKRSNYQDLYKFDTTKIDQELQYREFDTIEEVDLYVENLLNEGKYSMNEILVVQVKHYDIFTNIYNSISVDKDEIITKTTIYYDKNTNEYYCHKYKN